MVNISPSTLSVIAAALSGERAFSNVTHSRIEEALQSLLPGNTSPGSVDLQPGEEYLVIDTDGDYDNETCRSQASLEYYIEDRQNLMDDDRNPRDFDDRYTVYIIRKEVKVQTERTTKVTIS